MANDTQYDATQLDEVQHPTLGTLKFPKAMPFDERNSIIGNMLSKQKASKEIESTTGNVPTVIPGRAQLPTSQVPNEVKAASPFYQPVRGMFGQPVFSVPAEQQIAQTKAEQEAATKDYQDYVKREFPNAAAAQVLPETSFLNRVQRSVRAPGTLLGPPTQGSYEETKLWQSNPTLARQKELELQNSYAEEHPILSALGATAPTALTTAGTIAPEAPMSGATLMGWENTPGYKRGLAEAIGGLASPANAAMMMTMPENRLISLYYGGAMTADAYQGLNEARKRYAAGDMEGMRDILGGTTMTAAMALMASHHAFKAEQVKFGQDYFNQNRIRPTGIAKGPLPGYYTDPNFVPTPQGPTEIPSINHAALATGGTIGFDPITITDAQHDIATEHGLIPRVASEGFDAYHEFQDPTTGGSLYIKKTATPAEISAKIAEHRASIDVTKLDPMLAAKAERARQALETQRQSQVAAKEPDMASNPPKQELAGEPEPVQQFVERAPEMVQSLLTGQQEPVMTELRNLRTRLAEVQQQEAAKSVDLATPETTHQSVAPSVRGSLVDYSIPKSLSSNIDLLVTLKEQLSAAKTDPQREAIATRIESLKNDSRSILRQHLSAASDEQLDKLQDDLASTGKPHLGQAQEVARIIEQHPIAQALREDMREGEPVVANQHQVTSATQYGKTSGKPIQIVGTEHADIRDVKHIKLGDETVLIDDATALRQRTKLIEQGKDPDTTLPEGYKRVPLEEFRKLQEDARQQLTALKAKLSEEIDKRAEAKLIASEDASDEGVAEARKSAVKEITKELLPTGRTVAEEVKALRDIIGRDEKRPVYAKKGAPKVEEGVVKAPGTVAESSLELWRKITGNKLNRIPSVDEQKAIGRSFQERGRIYMMMADVVGKEKQRRADQAAGKTPTKVSVAPKLDPNQRGAIGMAQRPTKLYTPTYPDLPSGEKLVETAKKLGLDAFTIDDEHPRSGNRGWLSPDGKHWIGAGNAEHDTIAWKITKGAGADDQTFNGNTERFLAKGWIRKTSDHEYQVNRLSSDNLTTIADDGPHGRTLTLDQVDQYGRLQSMDIGRWEDISDLGSQVRRELRSQRGYELGASGPITTASAAAGMISGAAMGASVGGFHGAVIGGSIGFVSGFLTPAVVDRLRPSYAKTAPLLKSAGISMHNWMHGTPQEAPVVPGMDSILERQRLGVSGPSLTYAARWAQFKGDVVNRFFDKFVYVNDRPSALQRFVMRLDPKQAVFNKLKLNDRTSPYVSAWLASGGSPGQVEAQMIDLKDVVKSAADAGNLNHLREYLNLKNYVRVYQTLRDHASELNATKQRIQNRLSSANLGLQEKLGLENDLKTTEDSFNELMTRIKTGQVVPQMKEGEVHLGLEALRQKLSYDQYQHITSLADRVWEQQRGMLDLAHNAGIVGDEDYKTYVDRGKEYTPMHRIMESITETPAMRQGKSPLYLRQQNIIKSLEGSARVNVDPLLAAANASRHIIRESLRNKVINDFLDLGDKDPTGVGKLFKPVAGDYKATADESLVGAYKNGVQQTYATPRYLGETLKQVSPVIADTALSAVMRFASTTMRKTATAGNLAWSFGNIWTHVAEMAAMSKAGVKNPVNPVEWGHFIKDYVGAVKDTIAKDPKYIEALKSGALDGVLQRAITPEHGLSETDLGLPGLSKRRTFLSSVEEFNMLMERSLKTMTFTRLRETGMDPKSAAWETRRYGGGPDFSHMGTEMPHLNLAFMFLNAHLQYMGRVFAALGEAERRPQLLAHLATATMIGLAINEWNQLQKNKNGESLWQKVPRNERERNFVILTGGESPTHSGGKSPNTIQIKKPAYVRMLFNPIEDGINKLTNREDRSSTQLGLDLVSNYLPGQFNLQEGHVAKTTALGVASSVNPALGVPVELAANYNPRFGGRPIVPGREQNIEPGLQADVNTPEIYQRMGKGGTGGAIAGGTFGATLGGIIGGTEGAVAGGLVGGGLGAAGVSPRKLEFGVGGVTAGVGQSAAKLVDIPLGARKTFPYQGAEALKQTPILGDIAGRFVGSQVDQTLLTESAKFYDNANKMAEIKNSYKFILKNHPEQARQFIYDHKTEFALANASATLSQRIGELNSVLQQVQRTMEQNPDDKALVQKSFEALERLHDSKVQMMKKFNAAVDDAMKKSSLSPSLPAGWNK